MYNNVHMLFTVYNNLQSSVASIIERQNQVQATLKTIQDDLRRLKEQQDAQQNSQQNSQQNKETEEMMLERVWSNMQPKIEHMLLYRVCSAKQDQNQTTNHISNQTSNHISNPSPTKPEQATPCDDHVMSASESVLENTSENTSENTLESASETAADEPLKVTSKRKYTRKTALKI